MAATTSSAIPYPALKTTSLPFKEATTILSEVLEVDDFHLIAVEANAVATGVLNTLQESPISDIQSVNPTVKRHGDGSHARGISIGILDLEEEDEPFATESVCEAEIQMACDSQSDAETLQLNSPTSTRAGLATPSSSSPGFYSASHFYSCSGMDDQASPIIRPDRSTEKGQLTSPFSETPTSVRMTTLSLELQEALRIAEMEVSQLRSQVSSKTEHLEMAQRALVEYEDEVQRLRRQLKALSDVSDSESIHRKDYGSKTRERPLSCENLVHDLKRLKSGTHRIRQSLGGSSDEAGLQKIHPNHVLRENFDRLNVQKRQLEIGNEAMRAELEGVSSELQSALDKLREYGDRNEHLMEENRALKKERTKLRIEINQERDVVASLMEETPDVDKELVIYRQRLKEAQEQREMLSRDLNCARTELETLRAEMRSIDCGVGSEHGTPLSERERIEQANEERVLQLREVLNSKLRDHPEMLRNGDGMSEEGDRENSLGARERIRQLQEALALALEAKSLLEERMQSRMYLQPDGLKLILEDIGQLKENFQKERRMALRERTENENLIMALQQEKEELIYQMQQASIGLNFLQEETARVQGELANRRLLADEFKIKAEKRILQLESENANAHRRLSQVREALDLCLEAKHELELRLQQSELILSEWLHSASDARMQEEENFTSLLRQRIDSGNPTLIKQAALHAIEHLERLQVETQKRVDWTTTSVDIQHGSSRTSSDAELPSQGDGSRMMTVTSHQLRTLRKDLREMTQQRDDAMELVKNHKAIDARRFSEIQELQKDLNAALDQYETLLPQFHDVMNAKREMENKVQHLLRELEQQNKQRIEIESAVMDLLNGCHKILKGAGFSTSSQRNISLVDSILWTRSDLDHFYHSLNKKQSLPPQKHETSSRIRDGRKGSSTSRLCTDLKPLVEQLKSMLDKERDLHRYFESQSSNMSKLKVDTEQRSQWIRQNSSSQSAIEGDYPATEMQIQERTLAMKKLSQKEEEVSGLLAELNKAESLDQDMSMFLNELNSLVHSAEQSSSSSSQNLGDRISRLQECVGALEEQLIAVKSENKQLKSERQFLLQKTQSRS